MTTRTRFAMLLAPLSACAVFALAACAGLPAAGVNTVQAAPVISAPESRTIGPPVGTVSTADPRATAAGMAILRQGGSATDAAIAVMLALTVVEPQSSGIGGGGFYVHADAAGTVETLDGRETAPAAAAPDWFLDENGGRIGYLAAVRSGLSIGVPGNIALAAKAHERHGKLPWAALFQPAIDLARGGWTITDHFVGSVRAARDRAGLTAAGRALYFDEAGEIIAAGQVATNPALADTLAAIAEGGPEALYRGERGAALAQTIAQVTPRAGMSAQDVAGYAAQWRSPVCGRYRVYRICSMGPPSSGATTVLAILGQLERFDLAALGPESPTAWHLFAESQRLAYADRELYLADPDFVAVPVAGLIDPAYLGARGALIAPERRMDAATPGQPAGSARLADGDEPAEYGTSHFAVVDSAGNAVSYTSTIEGPFGSGHMFGGFFLNNELTDFSFSPMSGALAVANRVEGGKRPRSSMSPTLVFGPDGRLRLAVGAAGGSTIPVQVAKALIGVLDWNLPATEAIGLPGLLAPGETVTIESGSFLIGMQPALEALGHRVTVRDMPFKANAVEWRDGRWIGAADPRSDGVGASE